MTLLSLSLCTLALATISSVNRCLHDLYRMTNGPNWYISDGWENLIVDSANPCLAYGVDCDLDNVVIGIYLAANNLTGTLPHCLGGLYTIKELSLPANRIKGTLSNLPPNLAKISMTMTSFSDIDPNICLLTDLQSFSMSYCDLSNLTIPPCIYDASYLSIVGTGIRLPETVTALVITPERKGLSIPGVDASTLLLEIPSEEARNLTSLDLSNTHVSGVYNLSQLILTFPRVQDLYLGGNNLTGWLDFGTFRTPSPPSVLRTTTINLGTNAFKAVITGTEEIDAFISAFSSSLYAIDLSNNKILGIPPTNEELQKLLFKYKDFYVLNLENNTFLCTEERTSPLDCTSLQIKEVLVADSTDTDFRTLELSILLPGDVPSDLAAGFVSNLQFKLILSNNTDELSYLYSVMLRNASYDLQQNKTTLETLVMNIPADYDPADQSFKLHWRNESLTLQLRTDDNPSPNAPQVYPDEDPEPSIPKLTLDIYSMSRCPYFAKIMIEDIAYLLNVYPRVSELLTIRFSSLIKPSLYNACGGYSSHGSAEVTGDYYFHCLQNYTGYNSTIMNDFYACIYGNKGSVSGVPYNIPRCNTKVLRQIYNLTGSDIDAITKCSNSRVNPLISSNFARVLNNLIGYSPTMYLDEDFFCVRGLKCTFNDSPNHVSERVANMVERICAIYADKHGEFPNCTQRSGSMAQCPEDEIILGSQCTSQKRIVIIVSISCISFLLCLVLALVMYSRIKEVRERNRLTANTHRDRQRLLLTDSEGSGSDAEVA